MSPPASPLIAPVVIQVIKQQLDRDDNLKLLFRAMNDLFDDVYRYEVNVVGFPANARIGLLQQVARQTTECCRFIDHYCAKRDFCMYL